jgi:hypothetical protein
MARVLGYVNAILRGKLGGNVFSANRYGEYVRQYVKPVNPDSQGQANARGSFSEALAMWHSLTSEQKQSWQSFADTAMPGKSAINAYMSLRTRAINNQRIITSVSSNLPTISGNGTIEATSYAAPNQPPDPSLAPPQDLEIFSVSLDYSDLSDLYTVTATFDTIAGEAVPESVDDMPVGFGFGCYISNQIAQSSHFVNSPELIKSVGVPYSRIEPAETDPTPTTTFVQEFKFNRANFQGFPQEGFARLTFTWESTDGRKFLIGSQIVEVPPAVELVGP